MINISSTNESEDGDTSSFAGAYKFTTASGSQVNGTVTFNNDGTFSYSGGKSSAPSSGTYSVNGSSITINWTAGGYPASDTLNISTSGSSFTWTSNGTISVFASTFFGVSSKEITFTKE